MLMAVPAMLMTSACESMDDTNVDPTRMNTANAGSFLDPLIYGMGTYTWTRYNSWTFQLMQCLVTTNSTSGVGWFNISDTAVSANIFFNSAFAKSPNSLESMTRSKARKRKELVNFFHFRMPCRSEWLLQYILSPLLLNCKPFLRLYLLFATSRLSMINL